MKRITTLAVLLLATLSIAAETQPIYHVSPTHFQHDLVVNGYDTSRGPIRAVSICYRYKHVRSITAESSDSQPAIVTVAFQPGWLELRSESDVIVSVPFPSESQAFTLGAFDGTIDFEGRSGFSFRNMRHGHGIVDITDQTIVDRFLNVPTTAITARGFDLFTATGAGNLIANSDSRVIIQGEVIYHN